MKKILLLLTFLSSFSFAVDNDCPKEFIQDGKKYTLSHSNGGIQLSKSDACSDCNICLPLVLFDGKTTNYRVFKKVEKHNDFATNHLYAHYNIVYYYNAKTLPLPVNDCKENEKLNDKNQCVCKDGYKSVPIGVDDDGIYPIWGCKPKLDCDQNLMHYHVQTGVDSNGKPGYYSQCIARNDITPDDCHSKGGEWVEPYNDYDEDIHRLQSLYGSGCYDIKWMNKFFDERLLSFLMNGLLIGGVKPFPTSSVAKAINPSDVQKALALKKCNLSNCKPEIIDMEMGPNGAYVPKDKLDIVPQKPFNSVDEAKYIDYLIKKGYIKNKDEYLNGLKNTNGYKEGGPSPYNSADVKPSLKKNFDDKIYRGGDETKFSNNMIGSRNLAKENFVPEFPPDLKVGASTKTKIDLSPYLHLEKTKKSFPVVTKKTNEVKNADGSITSKYKSKVTYGDKSFSDLHTVQTVYPDGSKFSKVEVTTPIFTNGGTVSHVQNYQSTTDSTGATTNVVNQPSQVIRPTESGGTVTTPNEPISNTITQPVTQSPVDLSPLSRKLDKINDKLGQTNQHLRDIKNQQLKEWNFEPHNLNSYNLASEQFTKAMQEYEFSLQNTLDSFQSIFKDFKDFADNFKNLDEPFKDKPELDIQNGICPFTITGAGRSGGKVNTYTVDPCKFIRPYTSILTIFFTTWFSIYVIFFAIKHLTFRNK